MLTKEVRRITRCISFTLYARAEHARSAIHTRKVLPVKSIDHIHLSDAQDVYSGPEGALWELVMGEQSITAYQRRPGSD